MKKIIYFTFLFAFIGVGSAWSQCTPNPIYTTLGVPGVWPNAVQGIPDGDINVAYGQTLTVIVLEDTTINLSTLTGIPGLPSITASIDVQEITNVTGLPNGLSYACDTASCAWPGGDNGCIRISGTPTQSGTFTVNVETEATFTVPQTVPIIGGTQQTLPIPGTTYDLFIDGPMGIATLKPANFTVDQNSPNPVRGLTNIAYTLRTQANVEFKVYDFTGKVLHQETVVSKAGRNNLTFDASDLVPGIYLYSLRNGERPVVKKMTVME